MMLDLLNHKKHRLSVLMKNLHGTLGMSQGVSFDERFGKEPWKRSLRLPPQSTETRDKWFEVIESILLACCENDPGRSPILLQIGRSAANRYYYQVADKETT